jgi:ribose transport system permease protein
MKKDNALRRIMQVRGMGQVISVTTALIAMCVAFALINPNFMTSRNIVSLLRQIAPILIIGMGQSYVLITGGIDLSIGSVVGMSCMISATLMTRGVHALIALPLTALACLFVGFLNGTLISRAKLPPFIATLGTMIMARGLAQIVNGNMNTDLISAGGSEAFRDLFYYGKFAGLFTPMWLAIVLFLIFNYILSSTRTGRHIYALGSNYEAARFSGVNVKWAQTKAYIVSSFMSCIVGFILMAQSGMGTMDAGNSYELNAVAASVIGGVSTMGGQGLLFGTVIGSGIWGVLQNGLQFAGAPLALKNIVIGIVVIVSVLIDRIARGDAVDLKKLFGRGRRVQT